MITSWPPTADTCAMPDPIKPAPMTAALLTLNLLDVSFRTYLPG